MDWKDIKEALPLVLVFLVWIVSQLFRKKEKNKEPESFEPVTQDSNQEDVISVEEEIRRKIAQRQKKAFEQAKVSPLNRSEESMNQEVEPVVYHIPSPSLQAAEIAYQEDQQAIGGTASSSSKNSPAQPIAPQTGISSPRYDSVGKLPLLKEPQMLRQAFLYAEVLGPPLGAKKGQHSFQSSFWSLYD